MFSLALGRVLNDKMNDSTWRNLPGRSSTGRFVILNCYFFTTLVMIVSNLFEVQKARLVANDFAVILRD